MCVLYCMYIVQGQNFGITLAPEEGKSFFRCSFFFLFFLCFFTPACAPLRPIARLPAAPERLRTRTHCYCTSEAMCRSVNQRCTHL